MEARNYQYNYEEVYVEETAIPIPREKVKVRKKEKVKSKSKVSAKKIVLMSVMIFNLFMLGITIQSYVTMSNASIQVSKLNNEIEELETTRDYYKTEIDKYSTAERIEEIARYKLGMYYPENNQYFYMTTEK